MDSIMDLFTSRQIHGFIPVMTILRAELSSEIMPVLAGSERPYPRRCRTRRPPMKSVPICESRIEKPHPVYVPRDEAFEEMKQATFATGRLKAVLHNLVPQIASALASSDIPFTCFSDIDNLYIKGFMVPEENVAEKINNIKKLLNMSTTLFKYDVPAVIKNFLGCGIMNLHARL